MHDPTRVLCELLNLSETVPVSTHFSVCMYSSVCVHVFLCISALLCVCTYLSEGNADGLSAARERPQQRRVVQDLPVLPLQTTSPTDVKISLIITITSASRF